MASRIFHDLLLQRHDHLARLERQIFWVLVVLLSLHVFLLTPLLSAWHQSQQAAAEARRLADIGPGLDVTVQRLDKLRENYLAVLQPAIDEQIQGLELDLSRLEASRWQWQQASAVEEDTTEPSPTPFLDRSLAMSEPPRGVVPFSMPEALLPELRQASNRYSLLTILEPWVEEQIVRPRLQALQHTWDAEALPLLSAELDDIGDEVSMWRARLPEAREGWDAVSAALSEMASEAGEWTAQPPSQPFWWASPESEPRLKLDLGSHRESLSRPPALARLAVQQQKLRNRLSEVAGTWERRWAEVPSEDPTSGQWVSSWFTQTKPWLPAAIGLLLTTLIWGQMKAASHLISAVQRAISHGSPQILMFWCGARISGQLHSTQAHSSLRRQFLGHTIAALLWIGILAYQMLDHPAVDWTPWIPTASSAFLLLGAASFRLISLQRDIRLLEASVEAEDSKESASILPSTDDPALGDEDPVEIALRR